jgi:hypothetical protein
VYTPRSARIRPRAGGSVVVMEVPVQGDLVAGGMARAQPLLETRIPRLAVKPRYRQQRDGKPAERGERFPDGSTLRRMRRRDIVDDDAQAFLGRHTVHAADSLQALRRTAPSMPCPSDIDGAGKPWHSSA